MTFGPLERLKNEKKKAFSHHGSPWIMDERYPEQVVSNKAFIRSS